MSNKLGELSGGIEKEMWLGRRKKYKINEYNIFQYAWVGVL